MKLFCRGDHSGELEEPRDLDQELIEVRANLARLKKLPLSSFAEKTHNTLRYTAFGPMTYSVDNKDDAIAKVEAEVAELEVLNSNDYRSKL